MKTTEVKTTEADNNKATNKATDIKANNTGSPTEKVNNLPVSTAFNNDNKKEEPKKAEGTAPAKELPAAAATAFVHNNPVNKEAVKPVEAKAEEAKKEVPQTEPQPTAVNEQPKAEPAKVSEQPKAAEQHKPEIKPAKPALNLEGTLKLVEELHRRKIQRDKLLDTINTLEAFEVAQIEDGDETDGNHFQGCTLMIEDDSRRKFLTKNPVIIQAVSQYVNAMCIDKLSEIEAGITIPA